MASASTPAASSTSTISTAHVSHGRRTGQLSEAEIATRADGAAHHPASDTAVTFHGMASLDEGAALQRWGYHPRPLGPLDIELDISHCGICGSDVHQLESGWGVSTYPMIPGHEIVGVVTHVGSGVSSLSIGDRVGVGAQVLSCRDCQACKRDLDQYCTNDDALVFTYNSTYADGQYAFGGYQDRVRVHSHFAIKIPDALTSAECAPLLCAGATVWSPIKTYFKPGMIVGVAGIGGLGHLAVQMASGMGAKDVVAISTSSRKREDATKLGATGYVDLSDAASRRRWANSIDLLIVTANNDDLSLDGWLKFCSVDSRLVLVGLPNTPVSFKAPNICGKRVSITGSSIGSPAEIAEMFQFCVEKKIHAWVDVMPMEKANEGLEKMRAGKTHFRIVLENQKK